MPPKKKLLAAGAVGADGRADPSQLSVASVAVCSADKKSVVQFTDAETAELLHIIKDKKPIGMEGWREVESEFNTHSGSHPGFTEHTSLSLKQKFQRLCHVKKPTGDPEMPPLVLNAKHINHELHAMICAGELEGTEEEVEDSIMEQTVSHLLLVGPVPG